MQREVEKLDKMTAPEKRGIVMKNQKFKNHAWTRGKCKRAIIITAQWIFISPQQRGHNTVTDT